MSFKEFQPYPKYKDSGVEWLGEIPEHWEVKRLKYSLRLLTEKTDRHEHSVALENIESWSGRLIKTETEYEGDGVAFRKDDILFGKLRPYLAKVYLAESVGEAVGDFHVMRPSSTIDGSFAQYQILNRDFIAFVDSSTFGAKMPRASWDFMGNMALLTPLIEEQLSIASFLDRETSRIDTLISEKERLISLLQEYRQALISQSVTKGLDPKVKMKDSGVEWLGEIPEHWEVLKLKYLATICGGGTPSKLKQEFWEGDIPWVSPKDLKGNAIDDTEDHITKEAVLESSTQIIPSQTVLIVVRSGILQHTIPIAINTVPVALNQDMKAILFNELINPLYFLYLVTGLTSLLLLEWRKKGPTVESIESEYLSNAFIPVPPMFEQNSIAATLLEKTSRIDTLISESRRFIDLLTEYRSSLITAAITGKIDIRGYHV